MAFYKKKPIAIEARQFDGNNGWQIENWSRDENDERKVIGSPVLEPTEDTPTVSYLQIYTKNGIVTCGVGSYIIKGVDGEFYPCDEAIFIKTYDKIK